MNLHKYFTWFKDYCPYVRLRDSLLYKKRKVLDWSMYTDCEMFGDDIWLDS